MSSKRYDKAEHTTFIFSAPVASSGRVAFFYFYFYFFAFQLGIVGKLTDLLFEIRQTV